MKKVANINDIVKKGEAEGVAELDNTGKVPLSQLPQNIGDKSTGLPSIHNLRSGQYLYKANDPNRPISSVNEDQTVLILTQGTYNLEGGNIAIITTQKIDYAGRLWVTGRWSNNDYSTPVEVTDSTAKNRFKNIIRINPTSFKQLQTLGQSLTVERNENMQSYYDWISNNRPFSMYRQFALLIFGETIINTTYQNREAYLIGYGSDGSSSWSPPYAVTLKYKPSGTNNWENEFKVNL